MAEKTAEKAAEAAERKARIDVYWCKFRANKDASAKEGLIGEYAHLIKFVAGRLSAHIGSYVDYDDLLSYGIFGLIDAIDKFDAGKGVLFETYASLRIRGSIIDGVRKMDWAPRTLRVKNRQIERAYSALEGELGREPTDEELGAKLGLTSEETRDIIAKHSVATIVSLDDFLEQNHEAQVATDMDSPEKIAERNETHKILAEAIDRLTERERVVISAYYYDEMTLKEIAAILGVTESRVSQIHSKAVLKLRSKLAAAHGALSVL